MSFEFLVQPDLDAQRSAEVAAVKKIAASLYAAMSAAKIATSLAEIPAIRGTSHEVAAILSPAVRKLGFESQRKGLFEPYPVKLRPDWYKRLGKRQGAGILLEIERGKTITNNMDILDLWKCHICREAHHLFLVVPLRVKRTKSSEAVYARVVTRMKTFVDPGNKVNVATISVFGY